MRWILVFVVSFLGGGGLVAQHVVATSPAPISGVTRVWLAGCAGSSCWLLARTRSSLWWLPFTVGMEWGTPVEVGSAERADVLGAFVSGGVPCFVFLEEDTSPGKGKALQVWVCRGTRCESRQKAAGALPSTFAYRMLYDEVGEHVALVGVSGDGKAVRLCLWGTDEWKGGCEVVEGGRSVLVGGLLADSAVLLTVLAQRDVLWGVVVERAGEQVRLSKVQVCEGCRIAGECKLTPGKRGEVMAGCLYSRGGDMKLGIWRWTPSDRWDLLMEVPLDVWENSLGVVHGLALRSDTSAVAVVEWRRVESAISVVPSQHYVYPVQEELRVVSDAFEVLGVDRRKGSSVIVRVNRGLYADALSDQVFDMYVSAERRGVGVFYNHGEGGGVVAGAVVVSAEGGVRSGWVASETVLWGSAISPYRGVVIAPLSRRRNLYLLRVDW